MPLSHAGMPSDGEEWRRHREAVRDLLKPTLVASYVPRAAYGAAELVGAIRRMSSSTGLCLLRFANSAYGFHLFSSFWCSCFAFFFVFSVFSFFLFLLRLLLLIFLFFLLLLLLSFSFFFFLLLVSFSSPFFSSSSTLHFILLLMKLPIRRRTYHASASRPHSSLRSRGCHGCGTWYEATHLARKGKKRKEGRKITKKATHESNHLCPPFLIFFFFAFRDIHKVPPLSQEMMDSARGIFETAEELLFKSTPLWRHFETPLLRKHFQVCASKICSMFVNFVFVHH